MIDFERLSHYRENNQLKVKRAQGGFPKSLWETYSAFGNAKAESSYLVLMRIKIISSML